MVFREHREGVSLEQSSLDGVCLEGGSLEDGNFERVSVEEGSKGTVSNKAVPRNLCTHSRFRSGIWHVFVLWKPSEGNRKPNKPNQTNQTARNENGRTEVENHSPIPIKRTPPIFNLPNQGRAYESNPSRPGEANNPPLTKLLW